MEGHASTDAEDLPRDGAREDIAPPPGGGLGRTEETPSWSDFVQAAASRIEAKEMCLSLIAMTREGELLRRDGPQSDIDPAVLSAASGCFVRHCAGEAEVLPLNGQFLAVVHGRETSVEELRHDLADICARLDPENRRWHVVIGSLDDETLAGAGVRELAQALLCSFVRLREVNAFSVMDLSVNLQRLVEEALDDVRGFQSLLDEKDFATVFQPVLDARSGRIHHLEALCRFNADHGASPFRRLAAAEEIGAIHLFDIVMIRHVAEWLRSADGVEGRRVVAVNVSGQSLAEAEFADALREITRSYPGLVGSLVFEITDVHRIDDLGAADEVIRELRAAGHRVCLDDMSAGSASFQYLSRLDVDYVKFDGKAIREARAARKGAAFLSALTDLCRRIGTQTIAEMIDDPDTLDFARRCGVDFVQGHLFGKPTARPEALGACPGAAYFADGPDSVGESAN